MNNGIHIYHSGDLGDVVYAIPALRRIARPAHLTLYPNPGVTRVLMDEQNADRILPLLNIQPGLSGDWAPIHGSEGLRLDMGVRRFYRDGLNLADIHSNWVGHDHWPREVPWLTVDRADYTYPVVINRSARYRHEGFPWEHIYAKVKGRACFVGVPWEHKDFQTKYGEIDYVETASLLEAARIIAGADLFIGNQSCPRAIAEALKVPVLVEATHPNNTHFGRGQAWYPTLGDGLPALDIESLETTWCQAAAARAGEHTVHRPEVLTELARLTRYVRGLTGDVLDLGTGSGGTAATLAWCLYGTTHTCETNRGLIEHLAWFHQMYDVRHYPGAFPDVLTPESRYRFVHVDLGHPETLTDVQDWVLPRMVPGGIIVLNGYSVKDINTYGPKLGTPVPLGRTTNFPGLYTIQTRG